MFLHNSCSTVQIVGLQKGSLAAYQHTKQSNIAHITSIYLSVCRNQQTLYPLYAPLIRSNSSTSLSCSSPSLSDGDIDAPPEDETLDNIPTGVWYPRRATRDGVTLVGVFLLHNPRRKQLEINHYKVNMSDDKKLFGLLNGIAKHDYYKEDEITDEFLKGELYPDMSDAEFDSFVLKTRSLLKVR